MKITSVKQILEDAELMKEFEEAKTDVELEKLVERYDFSEFETSELNEEELEAVAGGFIIPHQKPTNDWLYKLVKEIANKYIKKPYGGGGGGGRGF